MTAYNFPASAAQKNYIKILAKRQGWNLDLDAVLAKLQIPRFWQGGISQIEASEAIARLKKL